eukprot:5509262-Amphidinium_carterae.2
MKIITTTQHETKKQKPHAGSPTTDPSPLDVDSCEDVNHPPHSAGAPDPTCTSPQGRNGLRMMTTMMSAFPAHVVVNFALGKHLSHREKGVSSSLPLHNSASCVVPKRNATHPHAICHWFG